MAIMGLWAEFIKNCEDIDRKNKSKQNADKCKIMDSDYCKNECPLCRLGPEKEIKEAN